MDIEIIKQDNEYYVDSRIVARGFDIEHESLCRSLSRSFSDLKSEESKSQAGRKIKYFLLTERQTLIIPAICKTTEKTVEFQTSLVDAFLAIRKQLQIQKTPQTYLEALHECARLEEKRLALEAQIEQDRPKVEFHDTIQSSKDCITVREFAKILGTGEVKLFRWLRERGYLISQSNGYNTPKQGYIDQGYFTTDEVPYTKGDKVKLHQQTKITPKGQAWLVRKYNDA